MREVPKALNMPLLFCGLPYDDFAALFALWGLMFVTLRSGKVESLFWAGFVPLCICLFFAFILKQINADRPQGYTRHILHKWGVWSKTMLKKHLLPPGRRQYSP